MDAYAPALPVVESDEDQEEEDEEWSGLEYARHHGLTTPYEDEILLLNGLPMPPRDDVDQDGWGFSNAATIDAATVLTKERLIVSKNAALLLNAVHEFPDLPPDDTLTQRPRHFARHAKQELPVLPTDNELDMMEFGHVSDADVKKLNIPSEVVNNENDEGFKWPMKYANYPAQCEAQIKVEKLAVSRTVLLHLQDAISEKYDPEDFDKLKTENASYKPDATRWPVTPPLLPLSPVMEPYIPSSPADHLPFLSNSSDSVTAETKALGVQIMEADALSRKNSDSSDSMLLDFTHPPPFSPLYEKRTTTILKRRAEELKVEGPLTPQTLSDSPMKKLKSVTFSETLQHFTPESPWVTTPSDDEVPETNSFFDEAFRDIELPTRETVNRLGNEKLSGADTTGRVDIPYVDFTHPMAPWNEYSQNKIGSNRPIHTELGAQMKFLRRVKLEDLKHGTTWHGVSSLERHLSWNIFTTKITKINLDEQLHGESEVGKVLTELTTSNIATSAAQVWKPDGLRTLDEEDDEDEIEPAEMKEHRDVEALIRKRKLETEEVTTAPRKRISSQPILQTEAQPREEVLGSHHWRTGSQDARVDAAACSKSNDHLSQRPQLAQKARDRPVQGTSAVDDLIFGGFSATSALQKFMETRGRATKEVSAKTAKASQAKGPYTQPETVLVVRSREPSAEHPALPQQRQRGESLNRGKDIRIGRPRELPRLPALPENLAPCSFIVSSIFLQQRWLMKQIEQMYAAAEFVYRDYELPHSPVKEADILLSPSTGLVLTTLQQIKQRPLPGQVDCSPIKAHITSLQLRFERLIVLVSEGLGREMEQLGSSRPDDPRDKEALSQFEEFAARLEGEVVLNYVRGGEQGLAHAVVVAMAGFGLQHGSKDIGAIKPLSVETTWEVFLRRAGLNPFAAQIIVASLQPPLEVQIPAASSSPPWTGRSKAVAVQGLSAFIVMSEQERVKRFQALMGGSRILSTVGKALDRSWMSAAHGFQM